MRSLNVSHLFSPIEFFNSKTRNIPPMSQHSHLCLMSQCLLLRPFQALGKHQLFPFKAQKLLQGGLAAVRQLQFTYAAHDDVGLSGGGRGSGRWHSQLEILKSVGRPAPWRMPQGTSTSISHNSEPFNHPIKKSMQISSEPAGKRWSG